jgi:RND family efflux transporter MFP subunit
MKRNILPMALCVLMCFTVFTGCGSGKKDGGQVLVTPVKVEQTVVKSISIPIRTSGRLMPKTRIKMGFKTGGIIAHIAVEQGDSVRKGEELARLNLSEIQAGFNKARNALAKAKRDLERVTNLYNDRAATLEQFQNATTGYEVARSNLEIARFNLDHSVIHAPSKGKILQRLAEVNEVVAPGYPVLIFGSTEDQWVVKAGVSSRDAVRVQLKDPARVDFDAYPGETFSALVSQISQAVDPASGTVEIELEIENRGFLLMAGFVARVDVIPQRKEEYTMVPVGSLVESEGDTAYVYVPAEGHARKTEVRVVYFFTDTVAVRPKTGKLERVITDGADYLTDGMAIKIVHQGADAP